MPNVEELSEGQTDVMVESAVRHAIPSVIKIPLKLKPAFQASIIVPVYNEVDIISRTVRCISGYLGPDYELIICDDASTDGTYETLRNLADKNPNIRLLGFERRIGKGGTIKKAVRIANSDLIVYVDADLSVSLDDLPQLLEVASEKDALVISRRTMRGRLTQGALRLALSIGYNLIVRLIFRTGITDHQCGFKAMNKKVARKLIAQTLNDGFVFDTELIVRARRSGIPVEEIEIDWAERRPKRANTRWLRTSFEMMKDLTVLKEKLS
jgi:glycosyltransferase involved in cell wall biosynthesis